MKNIVLTVLILSSVAKAFSDTNVLTLTPALVNRFAEELRATHPALAAARARTNAAAAGVTAVRTWDDPTLRLGGVAAREAFRASDGDVIYGAEQKLPLFGKSDLARRIARAELAVAAANGDAQFQTLRSRLAQALFATALADQIVAVGEQDVAFLQTITDAVDLKYRAGSATQVELLQAQNERAKRIEQLKTDVARRNHARLSLNRFLNRNLQTSWPILALPPVSGPMLYSESLAQLALKNEPRLRVLRAQVKQAQALTDSTRRAHLPDISLGAEGRNYSGNGDFRQAEFLVSFNLPLFNAKKYRADILRDESKAQAANADAADYELSVREEVHNLTIKIDAARRDALLYRDEIIPRSEAALASARTTWETGRGAFRDVLESRRMLLDARLMFARAVAEQYQMLSELVLCCGLGDLEALQMFEGESQNGTTQP